MLCVGRHKTNKIPFKLYLKIYVAHSLRIFCRSRSVIAEETKQEHSNDDFASVIEGYMEDHLTLKRQWPFFKESQSQIVNTSILGLIGFVYTCLFSFLSLSDWKVIDIANRISLQCSFLKVKKTKVQLSNKNKIGQTILYILYILYYLYLQLIRKLRDPLTKIEISEHSWSIP